MKSRSLVLVAVLVCTATVPSAQVTKQPAIPQDASTLGMTSPDNWGPTFYALEQQATRVSSHFVDGRATAERNGTRIETRLSDGVGNETATLQADGSGNVQMDGRKKTVRKAPQTLSDTNDLAYKMGTGKVTLAREIEVEFSDGLTARTIRYPDGYQTALYRYNLSVGRMRYITKEKVLMFQFPGLTEGVLTSDSMKVIGGWRFTPTMAWMHVQALGFYQFHSKVKAEQQARLQPVWQMKPELNFFQKAWAKVVPTAQADEPGCDTMHYLDGTALRPCCDQHDYCYAKQGCTAWSWFWPLALGVGNWVCQGCNFGAFVCFVGAASGNGWIWYPSPF